MNDTMCGANGFSQTVGDEFSWDEIWRVGRRGDGARVRLSVLSASGGLPHELFVFSRASPFHVLIPHENLQATICSHDRPLTHMARSSYTCRH